MISPDTWAGMLMGAPLADGRVDGLLLRQWAGTMAAMPQPRLSHDYLVVHLGGAKRVRRAGDGPPVERIVASGSLTLVLAGSRHQWRTEGPIAFAHLYLPPGRIAAEAGRLTGRDPRTVGISPSVGMEAPALTAAARALLAGGGAEALAELFAALVPLATDAGPVEGPIRLTRPVLRRVLDRIEAGLDGPLPLAALAAEAGLSPFHFARAFRHEVGLPPHRYVVRRRMVHAKRLLLESDLPVGDVARCAGYSCPGRFSLAFRRAWGATPSDMRR